MPKSDLQSQSEGGNVLQGAIRSANAAHTISNTFLPFFFALALLPPEEQIRHGIVPPDPEEAEEKSGDFIYVGHDLTIVQQHSP